MPEEKREAIIQNLKDAGCTNTSKEKLEELKNFGKSLRENRMEKITTEEFVQIMNTGKKVTAGSDVHLKMVELSNEGMKVTARLNQGYHTPEEIRYLMSELIGNTVDETFGMFPPFYTDCGKNIHMGKHVFINSGCLFRIREEFILAMEV